MSGHGDSLPLVVSEGDSLRGHFEVDHGGHGWRVGAHSHGGGLLHRLDACQGLHFHGAQVPHVAGCPWQQTTGVKARVQLSFEEVGAGQIEGDGYRGEADYLRPV